MKQCKHYLTETTCLLRQLAEGSVVEGITECGLCEVPLVELELHPQLVEQVAAEISVTLAGESGHQRAAGLARAAVRDARTSDSSLCVRCPVCGTQSEIDANSTINNFACSTCGEPIQIVKEAGTLEPANRQLGHFHLIEQVGEGSFGVVWKAEDTELDRIVAIKIPRREQLSSKEIDDFVREARASAALNHPHIVSVFEIGRANDTVHIVSDFVEGQTLEDYLAGNMLSPRESATICATLADALEHAHEKSVVHRDLKPANIAIDSQLSPTIMDFGLALRDGNEMTMTMDGKILGTPAYMPPEQARGEADKADRRSDIYSLGVVLFQMLTGERPFRGNLRMLLKQIMHDEPMNPQRLNSLVPRDLATICLKCLEKSPERRYQRASDLKSDIERFLDGRPISARPVSSLERGWRWCTRNPMPAALASLLLISLISGTAGIAWNWREATVSAAAAKASAAESEISAKRSNDVLDVVTDSFMSATPQSGADADMTAKEVLIRAQEILADSKLDALGRAKVLGTLSTCFVGVGEFDAALASAEQELELQRENGDMPARLAARRRLAVAYRKSGKLNKAVELGEETLAMAQDELLEDSELLRDIQASLASAFSELDNSDRAIELHEEVVKKERQRDPHSIDAFIAADSLASAYAMAGRSEEALVLYESTLEGLMEHFGPDDSFTQTVQNNLAVIYEQLGRLDDAITANEKLLERRVVKLGERHPDTISTMNNLAFAYQSAGRIDEAIPIFEETLSFSMEDLGDEHPSTMVLRNNLAMTYWKAKRLDKSIPMFEKVLSHLEQTMGAEHQYTVRTQFSLGTNYRDSEQYDLAVAMFLKAFKGSGCDPRFANALTEVRNIYVKTKQLDEFNAIAKSQLKELSGNYANDSNESLDLRLQIARGMVKLKQYVPGEKLIKQIVRDGKRDEDSWRLHTARSLLGMIALANGELEEAESLMKEAFLGLQQSKAKDLDPDSRRNLMIDAAEKLRECSEKAGSTEGESHWESELKKLSAE